MPWAISPVEAERVQRFNKRLRKDDPLRAVADALLAGVHPPSDSAEIALETLRRSRAKRAPRAISAWVLGLVPLDEADARQASSRLSALLARRPGHSVGCLILGAVTYILWILAPIYGVMDKLKNDVREIAAIALGRIGRKDNIGDLVDAVMEMKRHSAFGDKQVRFAAAYGLQLMLQNMPHGGLGALNEDGLRSVAQLLRETPEARHVPVLEILRAAGGPKCLPQLEKFARKASDPILKQLAASAMETIEQRKALHAQSASLLRPAPEPDQERLLRSTTGQPTDPETLLRIETTDNG